RSGTGTYFSISERFNVDHVAKNQVFRGKNEPVPGRERLRSREFRSSSRDGIRSRIDWMGLSKVSSIRASVQLQPSSAADPIEANGQKQIDDFIGNQQSAENRQCHW